MVLFLCLLREAELDTRLWGHVGGMWKESQSKTAAMGAGNVIPRGPPKTHIERKPSRNLPFEGLFTGGWSIYPPPTPVPRWLKVVPKELSAPHSGPYRLPWSCRVAGAELEKYTVCVCLRRTLLVSLRWVWVCSESAVQLRLKSEGTWDDSQGHEASQLWGLLHVQWGGRAGSR